MPFYTFSKTFSSSKTFFIWIGRKPKVEHTFLIGDYNEGGMKDIVIKAKLDSLQIQWVKRLANKNFHSWKIIPNVLLKDVRGVSLFHSTSGSFRCL